MNDKEHEEKVENQGGLHHHHLLSIYTKKVIDYGARQPNCGRMERPGAYAKVTGSCGDTVEMFLRIQQGRVVAASYETDGCITSHAASAATAELACGRTLAECFLITKEAVLEFLGGLPEESDHCAKLAAMTLHQALRNYQTNPASSLYGSR
jgi:nitrogen fixation NifU-like protein